MTKVGTVYLVGAGPGDPGLMTLRGAELLRQADVVVCDALVNPEILRLARADAEVVRRSEGTKLDPEAMVRLLVEKARAGRRVVRLKGGDPYVFGRGGEEAGGLRRAGIPFEEVPGVSSAVAVPASAGIPLTHRGVSSSFTVVTGHEDPAKAAATVDLAQVAAGGGTKVILMGAGRIRPMATRLLEQGMDPATPVAMIRQGTLPTQQTLVGTLATIADQAEAAALTPPVVTVIGEVVRLREDLNWFERRPLFGQRVVVTRARIQATPLVQALEAQGAEVLRLPCIRFEPPADRLPLVEALTGLSGYDWLVFTSVNGVDAFFDLFFKGFQDLRDIGGVRLAAVGSATADRLREFNLGVDVIPREFVARELVQAMQQFQSLENLRILLLRAEVGTPELPRLLEKTGAIVDDVACYRTVPEVADPAGVEADLKARGAHWITFTSGSTVEHFNARLNLADLRRRFKALRCASIGPETSVALRAAGVKPDIEADPHTLDGLVAGMVKASR